MSLDPGRGESGQQLLLLAVPMTGARRHGASEPLVPGRALCPRRSVRCSRVAAQRIVEAFLTILACPIRQRLNAESRAAASAMRTQVSTGPKCDLADPDGEIGPGDVKGSRTIACPEHGYRRLLLDHDVISKPGKQADDGNPQHETAARVENRTDIRSGLIRKSTPPQRRTA